MPAGPRVGPQHCSAPPGDSRPTPGMRAGIPQAGRLAAGAHLFTTTHLGGALPSVEPESGWQLGGTRKRGVVCLPPCPGAPKTGHPLRPCFWARKWEGGRREGCVCHCSARRANRHFGHPASVEPCHVDLYYAPLQEHREVGSPMQDKPSSGSCGPGIQRPELGAIQAPPRCPKQLNSSPWRLKAFRTTSPVTPASPERRLLAPNKEKGICSEGSSLANCIQRLRSEFSTTRCGLGNTTEVATCLQALAQHTHTRLHRQEQTLEIRGGGYIELAAAGPDGFLSTILPSSSPILWCGSLSSLRRANQAVPDPAAEQAYPWKVLLDASRHFGWHPLGVLRFFSRLLRFR